MFAKIHTTIVVATFSFLILVLFGTIRLWEIIHFFSGPSFRLFSLVESPPSPPSHRTLPLDLEHTVHYSTLVKQSV